MQIRVKAALRKLFGAENASRQVSVRDDDRFLVSYPKSGNTWMRFLLAKLIAGDADFGSIEKTIPDIYRHSDLQLAPISSPRLLKSHEYFDPRYQTVVYLVRDPRDVVLSYFHHHRKFRLEFGELPIDDFVAVFLEGRLDRYGSWRKNVGSWIGTRGLDDLFCLLRYEDLRRDTATELTKAALHLGLKADPDAIADSVRFCEFSRMQQIERQHGRQWQALRGTRQDLAFVRKGQVGAWQDELPKTAIKAIERSCGPLMRDLGYL
jgi:hypothetical protein